MNFASDDKENPQGLTATEFLHAGNIYDEQEHTRFSFVRTASGYKGLPSNLMIDGSDIRLSTMLTFGSFKVFANNADESGEVDASKLQNLQFRYIVVSNAIVSANYIDWSDYTQVAEVLNIED